MSFGRRRNATAIPKPEASVGGDNNLWHVHQ